MLKSNCILAETNYKTSVDVKKRKTRFADTHVQFSCNICRAVFAKQYLRAILSRAKLYTLTPLQAIKCFGENAKIAVDYTT